MKTRMTLMLALAAVVAIGGSIAVAQEGDHSQDEMKAWMEAAAPGPHHKHYEEMVGMWDAKTTSWMAPGAEPVLMDGKCEYKLILGGRYLVQTMEGEMMGMPFTGMGLSGYDNIAKKHTVMWVDNMSTQMMFSQGECKDHCSYEEHKTTMKNPMGDDMPIRMVTKVVDTDKHIFEYYMTGPDGTEFKSMEIVYTRSS